MPLNPAEWSGTAASNDIADSGINWQEGQVPGSVNASARAMMAALARYLADNNGTKSTAGSSNAYTLASPNVGYTALLNGLTVRIRASFTNTTASTFDLNSLGAKKILTPDAVGILAPGQIQSGGHYTLEYDSSADSASGAWILLNPSVRSGTIEEYAGATLPTGYFWCDGSAVSRTTYPGLFSAVSTTFGVGDGTTTFNVPDKRGRVGIGRDDMGGSAASRITNAASGITGTTLGASGGTQTHTLTTAQLPTITPAGTISQITPAGSITAISGTISVSGSVSGTGANVTVGITDTGHIHGVTDPGHAHNQNNRASFVTAASGGQANIWTSDATVAVSSNTTGVTVNSGTTGITAAVSSTGIAAVLTWAPTAQTFTFSSGTFAGTATTPTFTGTPFGSGTAHLNVQPSIVTNFIIKF